MGLINRDILIRFIWALPALIAGIWAGSRTFIKSGSAELYRKVVLALLGTLALLLLLRALIGVLWR